MATQTITVRAAQTGEIIHQDVSKFRRVADAVAANWDFANGLLLAQFNCGGSFGDERAIVLYTQHYEIDAIVTR